MLAHVRQRIHGWFAGFHQKLHRVIAHSGPRVSQVAGEIGGGFLRELESLPARVANRGCANLADAVNAALDFGFRHA